MLVMIYRPISRPRKMLCRYENSQSAALSDTNRSCWRSYASSETSVSAISCPYAPTFCTGAAPAVPGIADSASMPLRPLATVLATIVSRVSPAPTVIVVDSSSSAITEKPGIRLRATMPAKPLSWARVLLPPPRTKSSACCWRAIVHTATTSSLV